ncbi:MAG: secretin N-terminal domain-containing protein [Sedimentisphaerales bacterium]|jgi:type II secretory pathway component GspD/PulD (secretin)
MNKLITKIAVCAFLVLVTSIAYSGEQAGGGQTADTGRDDPFGGGFGDTASESQVIPAIGDLIGSNQPLFVRTVTLKFLNAANLKTALEKMSSANGRISIDDNTNSIIVCDTKENLDRIVTEIRKADQTPKQVIIEVFIIDVQLQNDTEIGVDWDILSTDNKDFSYRQSTIFPNRLSIVAPTTITNDSMSSFQHTSLGSEVAIVTNDIRNVLHLLQQKRSVDILASPRVMVVSGQKASIKTVEEIPYQEVTQSSAGGGGTNAITSTQFKDVGVTMEVKATITDEGKVLLTVSPSQSVTTGTSIGGVPVIDKREATTTLLMDDGQVVVMGGLRRQDTQITKNQVPLLGDLPLIGFIFSNTHKVVQNTELLVLLSPHINENVPVPAEAMTRFNEFKNRPVLSLPAEPNL